MAVQIETLKQRAQPSSAAKIGGGYAIPALAGGFHGLNRAVSPQDLAAAESPDCTDCRSSGKLIGSLGPRLGRTRITAYTSTLLGMGLLVTPYGRFRMIATADGVWTAEVVTWNGQTPATPTMASITGMDGTAAVRFLQYGNRIYAFNGRNRMRCFDGDRWTYAGILGGGAAPTFAAAIGGNTSSTPAAQATAVTRSNGVLYVRVVSNVVSMVISGEGADSGQVATITGMAESAYNGTFTLTGSTRDLVFPPGTTGKPKGTYTITFSLTHADQAWTNSSSIVGALGKLTTPGIASQLNATVPAGTSTLAIPSAKTVTNAVLLNNVATLTSTTHGFLAGQWVVIAVSNSSYNGTYLISAVTANTFSYALFKTDIASAGVTGTGTQLTLTGTYYYYIVAANSGHRDKTGRMIEAIPSALSAAITAVAQTITITNIPATHSDPQVDTFNIYRTTNGGFDSGLVPDQQDFFLVGSVAIGITSFVDTSADATGWYQSGTTFNRLRFNQNIPATFKYGAIYGDRLFGCGFDPYYTGTVTASGAALTFSGAVLTDGMKGCSFRVNGDDALYVIESVSSATTATIDRVYVGTASGAGFTIFREPSEIYFSEFLNVEACGPDSEGLRNKLAVPDKAIITGEITFEGHLLVFSLNSIYGIVGVGPSRTDIQMLTSAIFYGAGAVSGDAVIRVDNEVHFLSRNGPQKLAAFGSSAYVTPDQYGIPLNVDWLDSLTISEMALACAGSDGRDVFYSVPVSGQTLNSKSFRYERSTESWWEETEMCPTRYVRQDGPSGKVDQLYFLQGASIIQPSSGTTDLVTALTGSLTSISKDYGTLNMSVTSNVATISGATNHGLAVGSQVWMSGFLGPVAWTLVTVTVVVDANSFKFAYVHADNSDTTTLTTRTIINDSAAAFPTTNGGLSECYVRIYLSDGTLVATRRIVSNTATSITWSTSAGFASTDLTQPGHGYIGDPSVAAGTLYEIGNIGWKWLTRTVEVPVKLNKVVDVHATFNVKSPSVLLYKTDIVDGVESTHVHKITGIKKASKWPTNRANRDYAARLSSRTGAIVRHVDLETQEEADIK